MFFKILKTKLKD